MPREKVQYENIESETFDFGRNNFFEISKSKAISKSGESIFISLSKGYYPREMELPLPGEEKREKRYKSNFTVPYNDEVKEFIIKKLKEL